MMTGKDMKAVRDGKDCLPEPLDLEDFATEAVAKQEIDDNLDEALRETFPASDPIASGKFD